jgi:phosphopantetheinyl transferase (holo-ACP synthase)
MLTFKIQNSLINRSQSSFQMSKGSVYSRSHSRGKTLISWTNSDQISAIGVDMESKCSRIKKTSERLYLNNFDKMGTMDSVTKWCIKEACFKAVCNYSQEQGLTPPKLLMDVTIRDNSFFFHAGHKAEYFSSYIVLDDNEWIRVFAVISTKKELHISEQDICMQTVDNNHI